MLWRNFYARLDCILKLFWVILACLCLPLYHCICKIDRVDLFLQIICFLGFACVRDSDLGFFHSCARVYLESWMLHQKSFRMYMCLLIFNQADALLFITRIWFMMTINLDCWYDRGVASLWLLGIIINYHQLFLEQVPSNVYFYSSLIW